MKSIILTSDITKQRELEGLSTWEMRVFKRVRKIKFANGEKKTIVKYWVHFTECGTDMYYDNYDTVRKVVR